ncbi:MAG: peptidase S41 [Gemmatimonadota bacterium]|nr:MAG: peptidase S41 [Gemmatimonadota bacterium]
MRLQQIAPLLISVLVTAQTLAAQEEPATPPDLSAAEKIYGLSLIWQEANYNFAYFDQVPDLDWDSVYRAFIPQVLATGSTFEYYQTLKRFVALLEDGHSTVVEPRALWNVETYPWVLTRNVQGRVLVANVGRELEEEVPIGSVIETVDGVPAAQHALEQQLLYVFASTDHYRWDQALGRALNGPAEQPLWVTYVTPDGERRERTLARDRRSREDEWILPTRSTRPRFEFRWLDDEIAYVALNTFGDAGVVEDFEAALPELYRAVALVIDIRHNSGGSSSNGYGIAAYLTDDTLRTSGWRTREHVAAYKAWGRWSENWQEFSQMNAWHDGGTHGAVAPADAQRVIVPTVVLQEHATYSAAEDFLVAIDGIAHITTVGRPSGGSTGQPLTIGLPGGGSAQVCTKRDTYPDGRDFVGIGIAPDVVVEPTIEDVQAGRDPALEKAVELLRGRLAER